MPSLALSPVIVSEGHSGSTPATLTVTLSATSSQDWPDIRLPRGTAAELIDSDRGEA